MNDTPTAPENMPTAPETTTTETPISVPEAAPETGSPASSDPKPSKKGINWKFIAIIATVVLFGALLGGGGAYYYMAAQDDSSDTTAEATPTPTVTATPTATPSPIPSTTATPNPTPTTDPTAGWKTYSNSVVSFKYPSDWVFDTNTSSCPENNVCLYKGSISSVNMVAGFYMNSAITSEATFEDAVAQLGQGVDYSAVGMVKTDTTVDGHTAVQYEFHNSNGKSYILGVLIANVKSGTNVQTGEFNIYAGNSISDEERGWLKNIVATIDLKQ